MRWAAFEVKRRYFASQLLRGRFAATSWLCLIKAKNAVISVDTARLFPQLAGVGALANLNKGVQKSKFRPNSEDRRDDQRS